MIKFGFSSNYVENKESNLKNTVLLKGLSQQKKKDQVNTRGARIIKMGSGGFFHLSLRFNSRKSIFFFPFFIVVDHQVYQYYAY